MGILYFWKKIFGKRHFSDSLKFRGGELYMSLNPTAMAPVISITDFYNTVHKLINSDCSLVALTSSEDNFIKDLKQILHC